MQRPHASDVREQALDAIDAGRSVADVAAFYRNDPSTIRHWIRQRNRTGSARIRSRSGRPRKPAPAQEPQLVAQITAHLDATLAGHCARWAEQTDVRVSVSTMGRWLRRLELTLKKDADRARAGRHRAGRLAGRDHYRRPDPPNLS